MKLKFSKMHGLGNDFMVIDGVRQSFEPTSERVAAWANRHFGVGFDQMLLVEKAESEDALFKYRIFNADGGEVAQCGNGARCFARFVRAKGLTEESRIPVETKEGLLVLNVIDEERVQVDMGIPEFNPAQIPFNVEQPANQYRLMVNGQEVEMAVLAMGNPHAVILVDDVSDAPVESLGIALQAHSAFPRSVNVGFLQILERDFFKLRVYERGVGETLACGSGACAAMVAGQSLGLLDTSVTASLKGGLLHLDWPGEAKPVMMTGPTAIVYEGELEL